MYTGTCHCGTIKFEVSEAPEKLLSCNCSLCYRNGALWGHLPVASVTISAPAGSSIAYVQGDKTLATHTCRTCGCTTHWENLQPDGDRMAVNFRMCPPEVVDKFRIRRFDGADTWEFLD